MNMRLSPGLGNADYEEQVYASYTEDPTSVSEGWKSYFQQLNAVAPAAPRLGQSGPEGRLASQLASKQAAVLKLIHAYRFRGHRRANLDPLQLYQAPEAPDLDFEFHGLSESDLEQTFNTGTLYGPAEAKLTEILDLCKRTYCGSIGAEFMYLTSTEQKRWIKKRMESVAGDFGFSWAKRRNILERLTAGRMLEEYLGKKYVGQKRFSLEGAECLIPLLDELTLRAGAASVEEIVIAMAHRGRLNVLVNILGKHPKELFGEFEGNIDVGKGSGDVKYHKGFSCDMKAPGGPIHMVLAFNPSHLEIIGPVVEGSVRARQERRRDLERNQVLPVQIHGDAAFAGQGVVAETINLSETRGYTTGGSVHIVVNNQIGFTTSHPLDSRSTLYCTDVAKMVQAPIFHVNGKDPEAVLFVTRLALDYRMRFNKDVVVDMICYRRHGHNEADEPLVTQPMMYKKIRAQESLRSLYAQQLVSEGVLKEGEPEQMMETYRMALEANEVVSRPMLEGRKTKFHVDWTPYLGGHWRDPVTTAIPEESIERLGLKMSEIPEDFEVHRSIGRTYAARREMARGLRPIDWGFAETLAYASLLEAGYSVRMSGQDSQRGTFFHRHAVLHHQSLPGDWIPLENLFEGQPAFHIYNSLLSEEAVLGFEFGYSSSYPECLTIWEAQFGDFANGAQVVIDQFITSSEAKWNRFSGLVMMLPHGFDGQGPEHSSARLERYLQLCADDNIQVCVPTTPAQMFHMLRRQMLRPMRRPLIIMSPKSLLRHRLSTSSREDLAQGKFHNVIDEVDGLDPKAVTRLVLCSGKVYYDILEKRREQGLKNVAIARVEQLYPYPGEEIEALLGRYPDVAEVVWTQEEPKNQGAWFHMQSPDCLAGSISATHKLSYAGRGPSASPAVGYLNVHAAQQRALVSTALGLDPSAKS
ncbi:MAG: 2-oxoglutarate dehydrogenase E1 component [Chromatiaceae bacterium]|nr:2-oxoglutarate dehydrogenase E1 component [Chromatiaceae bacterium]